MPNSITSELPGRFVLLGRASTVFKDFRQLYASLRFEAFFSTLTKRSYTLIKTHVVLVLVEFIFLF